MGKLLGFKTILGGVIYAAGQAMVGLDPPMGPVGHVLMGVGALLGAVGVAHKGAKILKAIETK